MYYLELKIHCCWSVATFLLLSPWLSTGSLYNIALLENNGFIKSALRRNLQLCIMKKIGIAFYYYSKAKEVNTEEVVALRLLKI